MERLTLYYKSRKQYDIIQTSDRHENEQREIMAMNKLAEYENFMEENGFESLEDVKRLLETISVALGDTNSERIILREDYKLISKFNEEYKQEIKQLKHDLAVRDKVLELALISRKEMLEKQNCFTCSVEKAKIEFLEQAEKELKEIK